MSKFFEQYHDRFGSVTNKLFQPETGEVVGDGINMKYELGPADSVRMQTNPLGDIANPANIDPGTVKIRWNESDSNAHDFTQVSARTQTTIYTKENGSRGTIVDLVDRIYNSIMKDYNEKLAILRHCGRSAQLGLVNGTPKQNDKNTYSAATATASNSAGMRIKLDTGSISVLRPNARYDFINPSTGAVRAGNIHCTDVNFVERSAGFKVGPAGRPSDASTGNLANVADNDIIVYSGTYNQGIWSFGSYFEDVVDTATFMTGANRMSAAYRWMIPMKVDAGSAALSQSHFNQLAIAQNFISEDPATGVVFMSDPTQHQVLRNELGEESFIQITDKDDRYKKFYNFGSTGLNYQHASYGIVKIQSDPLARSDRVLVLLNGKWKTLSYAWKGLRPIRETNGSHWYRMNQATPNTGKGLAYCADWVGNVADWCNEPWRQGAITSLAVASI